MPTATQNNTYAVIMAGGRGERFWPLSTSKTPKQVLSLVGGKPLIACAVERLEGLIPPERTLVVTSAELVDVTRRAAPELPAENVIGEPFGRDTAAAVALGGAVVRTRCEGAAFCVLTADHIIKDLDVFRRTLSDALDLARREDVLITIGINPTGPNTGFGYIEAGELVSGPDAAVQFRKARRFVEKPDEPTARRYVESGDFFWNSGMFVWSVDALTRALRHHRPALAEMMDRLSPVVDTGAFAVKLLEEYEKLERISVDYALMEKADNIVMARGAFRWYDVGSWPALEDHFDRDERGNVILGRCTAIDADNTIVVSRSRLTALLGVSDLVVVQADGATLVCARDRAQDVKRMVTMLKDAGGNEDVL